MKTGSMTILLCLLSLLLLGCGKDEPAALSETGGNNASASSSSGISAEPEGIMEVVEFRWQERTAKLSKRYLDKELIDKRELSKVVGFLSDDEFTDLFEYMKAKQFDELSGMEAGTLGMLVRWLGRRGDRERLVALLSTNCPREVGPVTIEYSLGVAERMEKMPDAFMALVEAYDVAQNVQASEALLAALGDALPSLRANIPDDDAFVSACAEWHRKHRGRFELSSKYVFAWQDHRFTNQSVELFILK